jgi:hypothetical protein
LDAWIGEREEERLLVAWWVRGLVVKRIGAGGRARGTAVFGWEEKKFSPPFDHWLRVLNKVNFKNYLHNPM